MWSFVTLINLYNKPNKAVLQIFSVIPIALSGIFNRINANLYPNHTTPVNDQLPLLIGQLEKQSGRSIARVSGEKEKSVVWCRCKQSVIPHTVMPFEFF